MVCAVFPDAIQIPPSADCDFKIASILEVETDSGS